MPLHSRAPLSMGPALGRAPVPVTAIVVAAIVHVALAAAIPAVIAYNYFVNRVKHWATEMDGFTLELLNLMSRPTPKIVGRSVKDGV